MQALYYDRDGRPVSQQEWRRLGRQPGYSRVGYADATRHGRQVTVITFWSGIAGHGPDGPLIFCTCAGIRGPGGQHPAYQRLWGWPDIAAARAGHQAVTAWIAEVADFLTGHASQLPAPDPALPGAPPRVKGGEQAMDDALVVQVRLQGGCTVITVAGEVDIATAPQLGHHLAALAGSGRPVIADLDQVSFIDAAGLRVLAAAARQAAAAGGSLHVVSGRYQVRRVFALTGLDRQIPLARTLAGALAGLPAGPETGRARNNPAGGPRPQAAVPDPGRGRRAQPRHQTGKEVTGW